MADIIKKFLQGVYEVVIFFPVILVLGVLLPVKTEYLIVWAISLPLFYLPGILTAKALKTGRRVLKLTAGLLISPLLVWLTAYGGKALRADHIFVILAVFAYLFYYRGIKFMESRWSLLLPQVTSFAVIGIYFIAGFLFSRSAIFNSYIIPMTICGILSLVLVLARMNRIRLKELEYSMALSTSLPVSILKHNRLLMGIVILFIFILSFWKQLTESFFWLTGRAVTIIYNFFNSLFAQTGGEGGGQGNSIIDMLKDMYPQNKNNNQFFRILFLAVSYILLAAVILVMSYLLVRTFYRFICRIVEKLKSFFTERSALNDMDAGYTNEKELLFQWKGIGKKIADSFKNRLARLTEKEPKWSRLGSSRERICWLYRHMIFYFMGNGYEFKKHLTPAEIPDDIEKWGMEAEKTVVKDIAENYNKVRYGNIDVDGDRADKLHIMLDKLSKMDDL